MSSSDFRLGKVMDGVFSLAQCSGTTDINVTPSHLEVNLDSVFFFSARDLSMDYFQNHGTQETYFPLPL